MIKSHKSDPHKTLLQEFLAHVENLEPALYRTLRGDAAAAELERLQAIEAAVPQAVRALWLAINSDKDSQRRGVYKAAIAALAPQPGVIGDEKGI
jgi:hypothetical protein